MGSGSSNIERFVSVDIEASGPIPGEYSMLSLGACVVADRNSTFYVELKPINRNFVPAALAVSALNLDELTVRGQEAADGMAMFERWLKGITGTVERPIFVGFNAGFDWSFVNWYFHKFCTDNPFGFSCIDIKSYYMGYAGCAWSECSSSRLPSRFQPSRVGTHNALDDAVAQAEIFEKLLTSRQSLKVSRGD